VSDEITGKTPGENLEETSPKQLLQGNYQASMEIIVESKSGLAHQPETDPVTLLWASE
jgi:hypothetical protein